jgi:hypothetical protein
VYKRQQIARYFGRKVEEVFTITDDSGNEQDLKP